MTYAINRVAVIGASNRRLTIGYRIIQNLLDSGFNGPIYPVHPKAAFIKSIPAYPTILDVPGDVELVHVVVKSSLVPQVLKDCGKKGVKVAIINTSGFKELGPEGARQERELVEIARAGGLRLFGPNCQGVMNSDPRAKLYANFTFATMSPGHISIVAQGGGVAEVINNYFGMNGVGQRMYASNGNACDVTIPDIIDYLGEDDGTRVIVTYVEGLRDADTFMRVATKVAAKKPILAMKAGRTMEGAKAAASHTGGLAKEDIATDLIFKKAGILSFRDEGELIQAAVAFASQPIPGGNRVGIITNTGGPAVIATDVMVAAGLTLPPLSEATRLKLIDVLYPEASVHNPIDVLATGTAEHYRACMDAMMADADFDCVFINFVTPFFVDNESIARQIVEVSRQQKKPIVCNLMTDRRQWTEVVKILQDGGVPCFALPGEAARAMAALVHYHDIRGRETGAVQTYGDIDKTRGTEIVAAARKDGKSSLSAAMVYNILEAYKIPTAGWQMATDAGTAEKAAAQIGYPVVIKADAASILHKSDVGGVAVNLPDAAAVRAAVEKMQQTFAGHEDLRFFVQQYLPGGLELIMGAKAEEGLGHAVMFGVGGVFVEIMKDVVFNLTPVTSGEARQMLASIKGAPLLEGARGKKGVDQDKLVEIIQRLSQLLIDLPAIREMDLNPLMAFEDRVFVVDARISI